MNRLLGKVRATKLTHGSRDRKRKEQEKQKHSNGRVQRREGRDARIILKEEVQESVSYRSNDESEGKLAGPYSLMGWLGVVNRPKARERA